jgi:hypothetical protein
MTSILRRVVVAALLAVWSVPAMAATDSNARGSEAPSLAQAAGAGSATRAGTSSGGAEAQGYAAREKQSQGLQDFQGGDGYIYIGGGALTLVVVILLLLIIF